MKTDKTSKADKKTKKAKAEVPEKKSGPSVTWDSWLKTVRGLIGKCKTVKEAIEIVHASRIENRPQGDEPRSFVGMSEHCESLLPSKDKEDYMLGVAEAFPFILWATKARARAESYFDEQGKKPKAEKVEKPQKAKAKSGAKPGKKAKVEAEPESKPEPEYDPSEEDEDGES